MKYILTYLLKQEGKQFWFSNLELWITNQDDNKEKLSCLRGTQKHHFETLDGKGEKQVDHVIFRLQ